MSSRRKQSKPKSFGVNESIEDVSSNKPEDTSLNTTSSKLASDGTCIHSVGLPPIPSTDLLSFNSANNESNQVNETLTNDLNTVNRSKQNDEFIQSEQGQPIQQQKEQVELNQELHEQNSDKIILNSSNEMDSVQGGEYSQANDLNEIDDEDDDGANENDFNLEDDYIEEIDNQTYLDQTQTNSFVMPLANESVSNKLNLNYSQSMMMNSTFNDMNTNSSTDQTNLLQFKCKVCGKGFKHRRSLNRHVRLHSGEKNYKCPHCTTAFARSDHLKAHIRTHNNSKPYRCAVCQCGYNTQAALKVHIAHHHSKSKFKCILCNNMEFHSQLALEGHMYTKHSQANTEIDIETAMITNHHKTNPIHHTLNSTNTNNDLNENDFHDNYQNKTDSIVNNLNQQTRVKLADINNYNSKDDDHIYSNNISNNHFLNNLNNNSNSENRENLNKSDNSQLDNTLDELIETTNKDNHMYDDLNESANSVDLQSQHQKMTNNNTTTSNNNDIHATETTTVIDNYGEDDDEENNSDVSSSSLVSKIQDEHNKSNDDSDDIIIEENISTNRNVKSNFMINKNQDKFKRLAPKTLQPPPPILSTAPLNGNLNKNINQQHKTLPIPPPLLLPANRSTTTNNNHNQVQAKFNQPTSRPTPISSNNTYCEMCNARFSSVESFQAHMRNCHPNFVQHNQHQHHHHNHNHHQTQQQSQSSQIPVKMPYLTSILNKTNTTSNLTNGPKQMNESSSGGIIITQNGIIITPTNPVSKLNNNNNNNNNGCTRPNCNCSISPNRLCTPITTVVSASTNSTKQKDDELDYYYAIKETHYTCSQCNLTLFKLNDYMTHLKQEHCVEVYRCILCKQMQLFDNLNLLKEHFFQEHQSQKSDFFRCRLCINPVPTSTTSSLLFNNIDDLNNHLKTAHHVNPTQSVPQPPPLPSQASTTSIAINNKILLSSQIPLVGNTLPMPPPPPPPPLPPPSVHMHVPSQQSIPIYPQLAQSSHQYGPPQPPAPPPLPPNQYNSYDRFNSYSTTNKCYKCNFCDSDFAQQSYLNQHIQMVHGNNKLNNPVINNNFTNTNTNNQQQQVFSCQFCRNTFSNRSQLERHVRIHVSSIDLKCNICDKLFESQDQLSQHKLTHCKIFNANDVNTKEHLEQNNNSNSSKPNGTTVSGGSITDGSVMNPANVTTNAICVYCKQTIDNESAFKDHFKRHNNIGANNTSNGTKANSFICIVCRQTLTSNSEYNLHMRHHLRRISINNNTNNINANTNNTISINNNTNTNNTPTQHQQSHALNKPTQQQQQPISNSTDKNDDRSISNDVSNHHQINHANNKTDNSSKLRCSKCLVKFEVWQELADHIAEVHSQTVPVAVTKPASENTTSTTTSSSNDSQNKQITIKQERKSPEPNLNQLQEPKKPRLEDSVTHFNMLISDIMCEICSSKFDSNTKLQCHLLVKHEFINNNNIFTCPVCDESFTRPEVLIQHTHSHGPAARIYKCTECSLAFVFKSQLINHSFTHHQLQRSSSDTTMKRIQSSQPVILPVQTSLTYNKSSNQLNQMIRPINNRQIPNQSYLQYQQQAPHIQHQQPVPSQQQIQMQRFRCNDCSIDFNSFRFYQHHCQQVHNRTIISNNNNSSSSIIG